MVIKKIGIPASANGDVNSTTLDPASIPAPYTLNAAYVSFETATARACALGSRLTAGSKTDSAQAESHTMEHSSGVTLMLRKPLLPPVLPSLSERPSRVPCLLGSWLGGRKILRMGWRRVE